MPENFYSYNKYANRNLEKHLYFARVVFKYQSNLYSKCPNMKRFVLKYE